jgi:hypothetical protein
VQLQFGWLRRPGPVDLRAIDDLLAPSDVKLQARVSRFLPADESTLAALSMVAAPCRRSGDESAAAGVVGIVRGAVGARRGQDWFTLALTTTGVVLLAERRSGRPGAVVRRFDDPVALEEISVTSGDTYVRLDGVRYRVPDRWGYQLYRVQQLWSERLAGTAPRP